MSRKNKQSLSAQVVSRFNSIFVPGMSKHDVKEAARNDYEANYDRYQSAGISEQDAINDALRNKIFSYGTYTAYKKESGYFTDWCKENYHCKTLQDCRSHVDEWLQQRVSEGKSAYTLKLDAAALGKVYGEPSTNFWQTPSREREDITRSREHVARDYGFDTEKHRDIISFAQGTGLRRSELAAIHGSQLEYLDNGMPVLHIENNQGKGGRERYAPIVGPHQQEIVDRCIAAGDGKVWDSVPSHMDVHSYRSEYCTAIYDAYARPIDAIPKNERYYCRGDRAGMVLDKAAMKQASEALGHSRLNVIAEHYLRW